VVYTRKNGKKELTFDFAEGLMHDNLLFVDRETNTIWSQLDGQAIDGPLEGTPLNMIPSVQTTWKHWREKHPKTEVVTVKNSPGRPYYYRNWQPGKPFPREHKHDTSALGLGLTIQGESMFFPFRELKKNNKPFELSLAGESITIHFNDEAITAWAEDAEGKLLTSVLVYEKGWKSFNPKSKTYSATHNRK